MIDRAPTRLPGRAQALPRRLPAAAARRSTRSCATSTRSSPASASTSTRSPRRWPTSPPPPTRVPTESASGEHVHYLRAMGPLNPESLATYPQPPDDQPQQRLQPSRSGPRPRHRPAELRHPPVQLRDHRHAQPRTRRTNPPSTNGPKGDTERSANDFFEPPEEIRLRRTEQLRRDPGPRLHPAGPVRADLRQRPGDDLPAHLRTGRNRLVKALFSGRSRV